MDVKSSQMRYPVAPIDGKEIEPQDESIVQGISRGDENFIVSKLAAYRHQFLGMRTLVIAFDIRAAEVFLVIVRQKRGRPEKQAAPHTACNGQNQVLGI